MDLLIKPKQTRRQRKQTHGYQSGKCRGGGNELEE